MNVNILKSFTCNGKGGNGAGVVMTDNYLSDKEMLKISSQVGLSETAFVKRVDDKNYDVRFFTPVCEVDLCGHATIAAFYYIGEYILPHKINTTLYQNTKAGKLKVEIYYKNDHVDNVLMEQAKPVIYGEVDDATVKSIAISLSLDKKDICLENNSLLPNIVSTGIKDIIIPARNRELLNRINPQFTMISDISKKNDVVGFHVFTIENGQIYARNFAPLYGINEECATGTSNGALGALLYSKNILNGYFEVLQGEFMNEISRICVRVDEGEVKVGGAAVLY
ncbi:PhzF family phenazine biosynthesis protein [Sedimentibacter sp. zth1]|uniref:PhzF family phenazine biosynthesis protein n=1 Tax=Sedimentibacter sp. zth1 TaxID=2816908 RepID=UPI001A92A5B1|nr:PhzF family phenazine biosynthesis protein [Sedimentibacter sp. zth1]QSX07089.1 PhzF family phenazine biosynthesis protein [Sedimentibacter sp. zth1]